MPSEGGSAVDASSRTLSELLRIAENVEPQSRLFVTKAGVLSRVDVAEISRACRGVVFFSA